MLASIEGDILKATMVLGEKWIVSGRTGEDLEKYLGGRGGSGAPWSVEAEWNRLRYSTTHRSFKDITSANDISSPGGHLGGLFNSDN